MFAFRWWGQPHELSEQSKLTPDTATQPKVGDAFGAIPLNNKKTFATCMSSGNDLLPHAWPDSGLGSGNVEVEVGGGGNLIRSKEAPNVNITFHVKPKTGLSQIGGFQNGWLPFAFP